MTDCAYCKHGESFKDSDLVAPACKSCVNGSNHSEKPRYDEALLRIYLSAMPLGKYHTNDDHPSRLLRNGEHVATIFAEERAADGRDLTAGLVAALVHLLNAREQTEIPRCFSR